MGQRLMVEVERGVARSVFKHTIPYNNVYLSSGLGAGNRPFTIPDPLSVGNFIIYLGPKVTWEILIHELVHVWQGYNSNFAWGYTLNSLFSQMVCKNAYQYQLGNDWQFYNVEQQASIVEHWFNRGRKTSDAAYRYIRDNLWHPEKTERFTAEDFEGM